MRNTLNAIDGWFLGHTRSVKPKPGINIYPKNDRRTKPLKTGAGIANLKAAALKHPEVMIKIPARKSANSRGMQGIRSHLDYISRNGKVELEDRDGHAIKGKKAVNQFLDGWKNLNIPEKGKYREALNVVLSMPPGTNPEAVRNAAREFAREQFEYHEYVFAQHTDQKHPHVHICVLMRDDFGKRMNPRKNDLFEWRVRFAEKLRDEGVVCAATRRQHRGQTKKREQFTLRQMRRRGAVGNTHREEALALIEALKNNDRPKHPFIRETMQTRGIIIEEYGLIARELYKLGNKEEARIISQLAKAVKQAGFTTQAQQWFDEIKGRVAEMDVSSNIGRD